MRTKSAGGYLVFLNNDTFVKPGWLVGYSIRSKKNQETGIVGSKLVYPDGRLQEAGGIIWRDASGWNYGKFDDPQNPNTITCAKSIIVLQQRRRFPRRCFIMWADSTRATRASIYEDTDLAFKVRKAGYKVLYQPLSEVIHSRRRDRRNRSHIRHKETSGD